MGDKQFQFRSMPERPFVIAGPCMAESPELMHKVASAMKKLATELGFDYVFKASFDKANRTSIDSYRGPGLTTACQWFADLKRELDVPVLTDVHETQQIAETAETCDVLQIPAFLCRQTDLVIAAVETGRAVNVKKGQFLAPENTKHIVGKVRAVCTKRGLAENFALTERGASFGYGNLVVDMRGFPIMARTGAPVVFDVTHSLQLPAAGGESGEVSGGLREFAPVLARSATATGYLSGYFIEVHECPGKAKSDAATQLSIPQAEALLRQLIPLWHASKTVAAIDTTFR